MIRLTPFERQLRLELIKQAKLGSQDDPRIACVEYGQIGNTVDPKGSSRSPMTRPPFRGFNHALGHVSMYEHEHGRPMLTAIVINRETRTPGPGFSELARHLGRQVEDDTLFWQAELASVVEFWTDDDPTRPFDVVLERVMADLTVIKERIRKLA